VIFADYTCRTLCGPILEFATAGLEKSGLRAGSDYRLLVIGLNPKDGVAEAAAMRSARIGTQTPVAAATTFLIADDAAVRAATAAAGFRYVYDREHDQFAHPAAAFVVDAQGRITRVLSALGLDGDDLRLALVEASEGRVGSFGDRLRLLCYGFDPIRGIYTPIIMRWLTICAAATVIVMAGGLALLALKGSRKASA
jgi:protein SCO1